MLTAKEIADNFDIATIQATIKIKEEKTKTNNYLEQEEKSLIEEYGCSNIDEVLVKQKKILERRKTNGFQQQIIRKSDEIIKELGAKDVYEALKIIKKEGGNNSLNWLDKKVVGICRELKVSNIDEGMKKLEDMETLRKNDKLDLSTVSDDVLDLAIEIGDKKKKNKIESVNTNKEVKRMGQVI